MLVLGLPSIVFTKAGGAEQEVGSTDLPDKTKASGGQPEPFDIECELPLHHSSEVEAIEEWYDQGKDPVSPLYKKTATMLYKAQDDTVVKALSYMGAWISKLKYPDGEMENSGDMGVLVVTISVDDYAPLT